MGDAPDHGYDTFTAALGSATIREYPGADHDIHAQHPEQLAADLLTFADEIAHTRQVG